MMQQADDVAPGAELQAILPLELLQPRLRAFILKRQPELDKLGFIPLDELARLHSEWLKLRLKREIKRIEGQSDDPEDALHPESLDIHAEFGHNVGPGERLADSMARLGGSWGFIAAFCFLLALWIILNSAILRASAFDPFPFILLNLALSMLAALQAPVIMMSQNRQERKDRLRAEHDFRINLRAELELRSLHDKIDRLQAHQWQRLRELCSKESPAEQA